MNKHVSKVINAGNKYFFSLLIKKYEVKRINRYIR